MIKVINLFDDFLNFYLENKSLDIFEVWERFYKDNHEKFYLKLIEDLKKDNINYIEIGRINLKNFEDKIDILKNISENILKVKDVIYKKGKEFLNFDLKIIIYIGLGIFAGWATLFENSLTIIFDLVKIDELNWGSYKKLSGLFSHELSHLIHMNLRKDCKEFEEEVEPVFLLYIEGFAQKFGENFVKGDIWYMFNDKELNWCKENINFLKEEYYNRVEIGESINDFFGDWYNIKGKKMTGYFLGYRFIEFLEENFDIINISKIEKENLNDYFLKFITMRV